MKRQGRKIPEERSRDKIEDYKGEIKKLRKQVSQLQKENQRLRNRDEGLQDLIEEFGHEQQLAEETVVIGHSKFSCPHCHSSNVKLLSLRYEDSHYNCNECGKTGPVK